jgi:hypothetical protein
LVVGIAQRGADRIGGDARCRHPAFGQGDAAHAVRSVDFVRGGGDAAEQRPVGATMHRRVAAGEPGEPERVAQGDVQPAVAGRHGDRREIELGGGDGQQERQRVVGAWIAVQDDSRHEASLRAGKASCHGPPRA